MERFIRTPTYNSPSVDFDPETGVLSIEGRSIPEHANLFYGELINWAESYSNSNPPETKVTIRVDYLNSSSHKFLLEVFEKLEPIAISGRNIVVDWYYEEDDEEMRDTGKEYSDSVKIPFNIIEVEEL